MAKRRLRMWIETVQKPQEAMVTFPLLLPKCCLTLAGIFLTSCLLTCPTSPALNLLWPFSVSWRYLSSDLNEL